MDARYDLMVIGAGIAGLALARRWVDAGFSVVVLEAGARPGGCLHTARFALEGSDYWAELGAHTLFNSYGELLTLAPALEWNPLLLRRRRLPYRLCQEGRLRSFGAALRWGELARHLPRALHRPRAGARVGDYFAAIAGPRNYAQAIGPALDALLCQPAAEFPADLLFKRRARDAAYPRSFTVRGGLSTVIERLARDLPVQLNAPVGRIERTRDTFLCRAGGQEIAAARVALAVPADTAARLLGEIAPAVAERLRHIAVNAVDSMTVVLRAADVALPPLAGIVAEHAPYFSMVSRDVIPDPAWRGFTFHFRPGLSDEERSALAAQVLEVDPRRVVATAHAHHRLPALRLGHAARIEQLDAALRGTAIALVGNYFGGLSIEDCVERARREATRLAREA